jgi:hypothetical protein
MLWSRAIGLTACQNALAFLAHNNVTALIDPFCGKGTSLAAANAFGLHALGVEIGFGRCEEARELSLDDSPFLDVSIHWSECDQDWSKVLDRFREAAVTN